MKKIQPSIPEPCHENWDAMTPTQQGRFCNACAKEVTDFSKMSDDEVLRFFLDKNKQTNTCGRVYDDQLNRNIYALPKKKTYWRWQYMLSAFLFFMKPAKTQAQGAMVYIATETPLVKEETTPGKKTMYNGFVKDAAGNPVPYASIKIKGSEFGTSTGEQGEFSILLQQSDSLEISCLNFETRELVLQEAETTIILTKQVKQMGEVVITSYDRPMRMGGFGRSVRISRSSRLRDTVMSLITPAVKVYPNPVQRGNSFSISAPFKQPGNYTLQITDAAGRILAEKKITVNTKQWKEELATANTWAKGVYVVRITGEKGRLVHSSSLVLQ